PSEGASVKVRGLCRDNEVALDATALGLVAQRTFTVRTGNQVTTNASLSTPAFCEPGEVATGGGVLATSANGGVAAVRSSRPQPGDAGATRTGWRSTVLTAPDTGTIRATAYVVCAAP